MMGFLYVVIAVLALIAVLILSLQTAGLWEPFLEEVRSFYAVVKEILEGRREE